MLMDGDERPDAVTVLALAEHRLGREARTGADFQAARLPIIGGCECCGASIAAYNAFPSTSGYLRCPDCVGGRGYATVQAANREIFGE